MRKRGLLFLFVLTFAISAVIFGVVLWTVWTRQLYYNVYSDGEFWYREYLPEYFNLIFTAVLSVVFGLTVAAIICSVRYLKERQRSAEPSDGSDFSAK